MNVPYEFNVHTSNGSSTHMLTITMNDYRVAWPFKLVASKAHPEPVAHAAPVTLVQGNTISLTFPFHTPHQTIFKVLKANGHIQSWAEKLPAFYNFFDELYNFIVAGVVDGVEPGDSLSTIERLADICPALRAFATHPKTNRPEVVQSIIVSLNDKHGWTRAGIADWLETLDLDITLTVG